MGFKMNGWSGYQKSPLTKQEGFKPHNMYDKKKAETHKEHLELKEKGYGHSPITKRGLWDNIHAKRKRGETMRKPGDPGAPTEKALKDSQTKSGPPKKDCNCWPGHSRVPGTKPCEPGSCKKGPPKRIKPHTGGMSKKERDAYNAKTGGNVKPPQPGGGSRKDSYCARSAGIKKCKNPDKNGDCPNDIARRNWNC